MTRRFHDPSGSRGDLGAYLKRRRQARQPTPAGHQVDQTTTAEDSAARSGPPPAGGGPGDGDESAAGQGRTGATAEDVSADEGDDPPADGPPPTSGRGSGIEPWQAYLAQFYEPSRIAGLSRADLIRLHETGEFPPVE